MKEEQDHEKSLLSELQSFEDQGVSIWLDGEQSNPREVTDLIFVREDCSYMRDYIFSDGTLSELHFDRVTDV